MLQVPDFLRTTAFRHSLAIAAFYAASSLVVFAFVYWQTVSYASGEIDHDVTQVTHAIGNVPARYIERRLTRWLGEDARIERYGILLDANGTKVAGNMERVPDGIAYDGQARTFVIKGSDGDADDGKETVRGAALKTPDGRVLFIAEDTDEWEEFRDVVLRALGLGLIPIVLFGCLGGALFGRSVLRRLAAMDASIERIIRGDLAERLPRGTGRKPDEFDRLAKSVNVMVDDLQRLLLEVQTVGDAIAHDLRTPLTRVRTRLEIGRHKAQTVQELREVLDEATHWLDQTLGIITAVLRIGEIEHGKRRAAFGSFDAAELCARFMI